MNHQRNFFIVFLLLSALAVQAAKNNRISRSSYDLWMTYSTEKLMLMGNQYLSDKYNPDSALLCYTIVTNRYEGRELSTRELNTCINALNNLGYLYSNVYGDSQKAYNYLLEALNLSKDNGIKTHLAYSYVNISRLSLLNEMLYESKKLPVETCHYLQEAFFCAADAKQYRVLCYGFNDLAFVCIIYNKLEWMQAVMQKFKSVHFPHNNTLTNYTCLMFKVLQAYLQCDYKVSLKYIEEMAHYIDIKNPDYQGFRNMYVFIKGVLLIKMGCKEEALAQMHLFEHQLEKIGDQWTLSDIYHFFYSYYNDVKNPKEADKYLFKYLKIKDAIVSSSKIKELSKIRFLNDLKSVTNQVKAESKKKEHLKHVLFGVSLASIVIILLLTYVVRNYRQRNRYIIELYHKNMALVEANSIMSVQHDTDEQRNLRYQGSSLLDTDKELLAQHIEEVMQNVDVISSSDFSLSQLCDMVNSNYTYVSQVINEHFHSNFKSLLNEYRIKEACRRLSDMDNYGNYTIEAISASVGFKSRTNFAAVFKRITGLSASEFQKAAKMNGK